MEAKDNVPHMSLVCYIDGYRCVEALDVVLQLFQKVDFAWVIRTDYFRSGFGKEATKGYVGKIAKEVGRRFAHALLRRGSLPLTIDDCPLDEHRESIGRNLFHCWAAKFGRLFEGEKPYEFTTLLIDGDVPAYRMKPEKRWLIVVDIDPDCGVDSVEFDWKIFDGPPRGQKRST